MSELGQRLSEPRGGDRKNCSRSSLNRAGRTRVTAAVEPLEDRQLLSLFTGFSHVRNIPTPTGVYSLQVNGPGVLKTQPVGGGQFDVKVLGTSQDSTLSITLVRPRFHLTGGLMGLHNLDIRSGQIGGILASQVALNGAVTPLLSSLNTLEFGALGPAAQIDVSGNVGTMTVGTVNLGPNGHVVIGGDVNGGGQGSSAGGSMSLDTMTIDGGRFVVGRDSLAPITVSGTMALSHNGLLSIGRDQVGGISVGGSMLLDSGGELMVGRNLATLMVNGDVRITPTGSGISVGGNLNQMTVNGVFRGQGSPTSVDLGVGLDLNNLSVLGGGPNQGGIQAANINVGKNLNGLNVPHGIFGSWITAGVAINGVNVGADGVTAILNTEIDAGTRITGMIIGGDVKSGFPTGDTTGYPTRIIAGKVRAPKANSTPDEGLYIANGTIDQLVINGALIDAVLAASVAPYGGDGSLPPPVPYGGTPRTSSPPPAGFSNYNAPGGLTDQGNGTAIKNYSIRSYINGQLLPIAVYDTATDPNIHVNVLANGTINAVVTGGVVSSPHGGNYDFTGVFAVNTQGVNGGLVPIVQPLSPTGTVRTRT